jgi:uncharacterized membrane protein
MDWYLIAKFLHVISAILWLGGALIMVILGAVAERARNDSQMVGVVRQVAWLAERVYVPSSISTLVFGLIATWLGGLWSELWVILGLVGIVATIALGVGVLSPRAKKVESEFKAGGESPSVVALCREILTIAKFDMVLLYTVVAVMVLKPGADDWITLIVMALVIAGAAAVFLMPVLRRGGPAPA